MNIINFSFLFRENENLQYSIGQTLSYDMKSDHIHSSYWRLRLLQAFQQINNFSFLFNVFHFLYDIQASSPSPTYINSHWINKCTFGKVLDFLWHSGTEQQSLTLRLESSKVCRVSLSVCVRVCACVCVCVSYLP